MPHALLAVARDVGPWSPGQQGWQSWLMGRPQTKSELVCAARDEFDRLWATATTIREEDDGQPGVCEVWSLKDVLAHLDAWHEMFLERDAAGARGETPTMPAPGFSWAETPALNDVTYQRHKADESDDVVKHLRDSHTRVLRRVEAYNEDDLFTKKLYAWTGSTSVATYAIPATSSHYSWATKLMRKAAKTFATSRMVG